MLKMKNDYNMVPTQDIIIFFNANNFCNSIGIATFALFSMSLTFARTSLVLYLIWSLYYSQSAPLVPLFLFVL